MRLGSRLIGGLVLVALAGCSGSTSTAAGSPSARISPPTAPEPPGTFQPTVPVTPPADTNNGVRQNSRGDNTTQLDFSSDGRAPITLDGDVTGRDCASGHDVPVRLTLSLSRNGDALPGGETLVLAQCGPVHRELHPSAGRVHVTVAAETTGNLSLDLTVAAPGQSSHTTLGNDSQVSSSLAR